MKNERNQSEQGHSPDSELQAGLSQDIPLLIYTKKVKLDDPISQI